MTASRFDLTGRVALVTGSSRGIGRALAAGLAEAGATIVLNGTSAATVETARAELAARFGDDRVHAAPFDVTDEQGVAEAVARVEREVGPIWVLVNNAGIQHRQPMLDLPLADWNRVLDVNLTSAFLVGREAARHMIPRGAGRIINIGSVQTALARPTIAPYVTSKGGIRNLTQAMTAEWAASGLRINAIAPGYFDTDMNQALVADEAFDGWVRGRTPAGRWGQVDELVGPAIWLASDASAFVTGQVVFVDGGMTAVV